MMKRVHGARKAFGLFMILMAILCMATAVPTSAAPKAPNFELTDTDGNNWTLRQFEDKKVVLIDLMAITCESCKIVEKNLQNIYPKYKDDVFFISIDVWSQIDTVEDLRAYKSDHDVPWPMALDTDEVLTKYAADSIAKVVIVDLRNRAVFENTGVTDESTLRTELDKALEGKSKPIEINPVSLWALAVFAGVASFFSPCAFPMFPGYMAFYFKKNMEMKEEKLNVGKAAAAGTVAAIGIIIVYIIIGALIMLLGTVIVPYISALQLIIGILLLFLGGLLMTNIQYDRVVAPFRNAFGKLKKDKAGGSAKKDTGFYAGLFAYGAGYGGAAAACTLPVFLGVILAGMVTGIMTGLLLLILYTLIAAFLMIGVTVAIAVVGHQAVQKLAKYTNAIKKISGFVLLLAGVYLVIFWLTASGYITVPGLS